MGLQLPKKFRYARRSIEKLERENYLHYTNPSGRVGVPRVKKFYYERLEEYKKTGKRGHTPNSLWINPELYGSLEELWRVLNITSKNNINIPFRTPKLYKMLFYLTTKENDCIFDFFHQFGQISQLSSKLHRKYVGFNWTNK